MMKWENIATSVQALFRLFMSKEMAIRGIFRTHTGQFRCPRITDVRGLFSRPLQMFFDAENSHLEKIKTRKYTLIDGSIPGFAAPFAEKVDRWA
jgi:hypothetical protein